MGNDDTFWWECEFAISEIDVNDLEEYLITLGCVSFTYSAAVKSPLDLDTELKPGELPSWEKLRICALFESTTNIKSLDSKILIKYHHQISSGIKITKLFEKDWENSYRQEFKPQQFGKLWVYPSWEKQDPAHNPIMILDPGLAFGTGSHPTTKLCLQWLAANNLTNKTIVDFGCGSGILSIAAIKLGAAKVYAIDHDNQAMMATRENAKQNNIDLDKIITCSSQQLIEDKIQADVLMANILLDTLLMLADTFSKVVCKEADVVVSGILGNQLDSIKNTFESLFQYQNCISIEQWQLVNFKNI